jgi:beta-glucosidase
MVLLVNKNNTLPLSKNIKSLLVTGPNANDNTVMLGNYNGFSNNVVTYLEGIVSKVNLGTQVQYKKGCELIDSSNPEVPWEAGFTETIIAVMGLSPLMEGENGDAVLSTAGGDKENIHFPKNQIAFLKNIKSKYPNKKLIVLITTGSAIELQEVAEIADAVLLCWYAGEQGGNAAADIVFGDANASGKLPVTFYDSQNDLPDFNNYSMQNRTYRYITKQHQFNFGYGLSYTKFQTTELVGTIKNGNLIITGFLKNIGKMDGATTLQVYVKNTKQIAEAPFVELKQFKKIILNKNKQVPFEITVDANELRLFDNKINNYQLFGVSDYQFFISLDGKEMLPVKYNLLN